MPTKEAKESLLERPIGSVITKNVFVVLHEFRQLPKRQQRVAFSAVAVAHVVIVVILGLCKTQGFSFSSCFFAFALNHAFGLNIVHCPLAQQGKVLFVYLQREL